MEMSPEALESALADAVPPPPAAVRAVASELPLEGGLDPAFGTVRWRTLFCADRTATSDMVLGVAEFGPGESLEPHRHGPSEFYFCTAGNGIVTVDGVPHMLEPGAALFIPGDAEHGTVAGPAGLTFVYGFPCDRFAEVDYRFSAAVT